MRKAGAARDLPPPLELACLNALWALGEASVKQVREAMERPLAYTTVMTLLDRLSRKGMVERRKTGRAFIYAPSAPREALRRLALRQFLEAWFDGSERQLLEFMAGQPSEEEAPAAPRAQTPLDAALL